MGNTCTCSKGQIDKEYSTQFEFGEREEILIKLKSKFEKYDNSEFIQKEELDKLISSFPNANELITEFEEKSNEILEQKEKEVFLTPTTTTLPTGRISHKATDIIENIEPIKFYGDDDQYSVYNFNLNKDYNFTGKGYHITNNLIYYGNIENNLSNGKGILIDRNGNSISGDWENGQCNGKCVLKIKDLLEYEGDFVKNMKEGYGTEKYKDGYIYEGYFKNNKKNGKGKFILKNKETYEGNFVNDLYEGEGVYKWPSENREYIGHFSKGVIDGKGINKYSDGSTYEGYYKKGIKHGYGIYTWPNGKICKGNWINNKLHGNAYFEDGEKKYNITFRFGKIISMSEADENKIIKFKLDNVVNKDNINDLNKYQCSFCGNLIYDPHKCCKCDKNYCLSCIKNEDGKNKKCKACGEDKYETNADLTSELIKNIKVYCDTCKVELNYEQALNHVHK